MSNMLKGTVSDPEAIRGKSAYEIAVMHGFEGTEEEWLESLSPSVKAIKMGCIYVDDIEGIVKYSSLDAAKNNVNNSRNAEILQAIIDNGSNVDFIFGKGFYPFETEIGLKADVSINGAREKTTLVFPNSKGLVTKQNGYFHRMYVTNLCIYSNGHCVDFKPDETNCPNSVYWSEFEHLDLHSENGCCIYAGDNKGCDGLDAMVFQCKFRNIFVGAPNGDGIYGLGGLGIVFENISDRDRTNAIFKNCFGTWYDCNTSFGYADYFLHIDNDAPQKYNAYIIMENVNMETLRKGGVYVEKLYYGHTMVKLRNVSVVIKTSLLDVSQGKIPTHPLHFGDVSKDLIIEDVRYYIDNGEWSDYFSVPESTIAIYRLPESAISISDNLSVYHWAQKSLQNYNKTTFTRSKSRADNVGNYYKTVPEMNIGYMHGTRGRIAYEVDMDTFEQSSVITLGENSHCDGIVFKNGTQRKVVGGIRVSNYLRNNDGKTFYLKNEGTELVEIVTSYGYYKFVHKYGDDTSWSFYLQPNTVIIYNIFYDQSSAKTYFIENSRYTFE